MTQYPFGAGGGGGTTTPPATAPPTSGASGQLPAGSTYDPTVQSPLLLVEVGTDGVPKFVQMTQAEAAAAIASGRHIYEPTAPEVLTLIHTGKLNPASLPPQVQAEIGRLQHADPSIGPVFQTPSIPGVDQGAGTSTDSGFHFPPNAATPTTDPVLKDAADLYYSLYGTVAPLSLLNSYKKKYDNSFAIADAIIAQAKIDNAPGLADYLARNAPPGQTALENRLSPLTSSIGDYYFKLYGRPAPQDYALNLAKSGQSLQDIQRQLLGEARQAGAPGYQDVRFANEVSQGQQLYFQLWGRDAPPQYIENHIGGLNGEKPKNLFELEHFERSKPAFMGTKTAHDELVAGADQLTQFLGMGY